MTLAGSRRWTEYFQWKFCRLRRWWNPCHGISLNKRGGRLSDTRPMVCQTMPAKRWRTFHAVRGGGVADQGGRDRGRRGVYNRGRGCGGTAFKQATPSLQDMSNRDKARSWLARTAINPSLPGRDTDWYALEQDCRIESRAGNGTRTDFVIIGLLICTSTGSLRVSEWSVAGYCKV